MPTPASSTVTTIAGRPVKITRGRKSQTVSVCTSANQLGSYQVVYRLRVDVAVTTAELGELADLDALDAWLLARDATAELPGAARAGAALVPRVSAPPADDPWVAQAQAAVDRAITSLVRQFCDDPYLHRVEHSLHARLHGLLSNAPELAGVVPLGSTGFRTQLVHKEWPETVARTLGADPRPRGNFDLAVLSPDQLRQASLDQFRAGRIDPPIAIEVGLDYGLSHLTQDADKLRHSQVPVPYVLHLSRIPMTDQDETERLVCAASRPLRTAYAHVDHRTGNRRVKHLTDNSVIHT